jgi:transcriptional regulator with XRE-family HTH domain
MKRSVEISVASGLLQAGRLPLADACRAIRALHGDSQDEFARRVGLNHKVIKDLERGRGNPGRESLERIAGAAGLRLAFVSAQSAVERLDPKLRSREEDAHRQADAAAVALGEPPAAVYRRNAMSLGGVRLRLPRIA